MMKIISTSLVVHGVKLVVKSPEVFALNLKYSPKRIVTGLRKQKIFIPEILNDLTSESQ